VLKGIPADEFMETMGMFASSLVYDCIGCHVEDILVRREAFAESTPRIQRARQMVVMVNALNKQYFAGQPRVTCFTCHRGSGFPEAVPDLRIQYGDWPAENPNAMGQFFQPKASAEPVFAKYINAIGGIERVSKLTSYTATYRFMRTFTRNADAAVLAEFRTRAETAWTILDAHLDGRRYVAANRLTIADISLCGYLFWPEEIGVDWNATHPSIAGWLERIRSHPRWVAPYALMPGHPLRSRG
jgi:hypothetical protein